MILNLKKISSIKKIKLFFPLFRGWAFIIKQHFELKKLFNDSRELNNLFTEKFPNLKMSEQGELNCVSCGLCEDICPTNAIKIDKNEMISLPKTPISGEIPNAFHLDLNLCRKCDLCRFVCAADALELRAEFSDESSVDLVKYALK